MGFGSLRIMINDSQFWGFNPALNWIYFTVCHMVLATGKGNPALKALVGKKLLSAGPCKTLINLVGTGDRVIQNAIEAQSNWENGPGLELASLVDLAMVVFELLIASTADGSALGDLNDLVGTKSELTESQNRRISMFW